VKLYIVQYTGGGVTYDPDVYLSYPKALEQWLGVWREGNGKLVNNDDKVLTEQMAKHETYMSSPNYDDEWRFYEVALDAMEVVVEDCWGTDRSRIWLPVAQFPVGSTVYVVPESGRGGA